MGRSAASRSEVFDIYDFDKTIYNGDSSLDFYFFCLRKKPSLIAYFPYQLWHFMLFAARLEDRTNFKCHFFIFLRRLEDPAKYLDRFWAVNYGNIKQWYEKSDHSKDVIISASPEFLLQPVFRRLKAHTLIATRMDPRTGRIDGLNCRGQEKVSRLRQAMGDPKINKIYSDSLSDRPLFVLAKEQYIVKGDKISAL